MVLQFSAYHYAIQMLYILHILRLLTPLKHPILSRNKTVDEICYEGFYIYYIIHTKQRIMPKVFKRWIYFHIEERPTPFVIINTRFSYCFDLNMTLRPSHLINKTVYRIWDKLKWMSDVGVWHTRKRQLFRIHCSLWWFCSFPFHLPYSFRIWYGKRNLSI